MTSTAKLYGLVLSGGKSTRMGQDKGALEYHGIPQRDYLYQLLSSVCEKTFISLRAEQKDEIGENKRLIYDMDTYKGPFNGLFSAHKTYPKVSWLVLACDLPLITGATLKDLIEERRPDLKATAYATKETKLPEPLCAIWEPQAFDAAAEFLSKGSSSCPRKFLINSDIHLIFPEDDQVLLNANSEADYKEALLNIKIN